MATSNAAQQRKRSGAKLLRRLAFPQNHEKVIRSFFGERVQYSGTEPVFSYPLYLLGFSNRTGSNLLAEYLRATKAFGGFREQLNHTSVVTLSESMGITTFPDYFIKVATKFGTPDSFYGFKASWTQILMLLRCGIDRMYKGVKIIHLTRGDGVAQAISFSIAHQTSQWTSLQSRVDTQPTFDFEDIAARLESNLFSSDAIALTCSLFDIPRLHVTYEVLTENPQSVMSEIEAFSGRDFGAWEPQPPLLEKQSGSINDKYRERFIASARRRILAAAGARKQMG